MNEFRSKVRAMILELLPAGDQLDQFKSAVKTTDKHVKLLASVNGVEDAVSAAAFDYAGSAFAENKLSIRLLKLLSQTLQGEEVERRGTLKAQPFQPLQMPDTRRPDAPIHQSPEQRKAMLEHCREAAAARTAINAEIHPLTVMRKRCTVLARAVSARETKEFPHSAGGSSRIASRHTSSSEVDRRWIFAEARVAAARAIASLSPREAEKRARSLKLKEQAKERQAVTAKITKERSAIGRRQQEEMKAFKEKQRKARNVRA